MSFKHLNRHKTRRKNTDPLRKIVGKAPIPSLAALGYTVEGDLLECGHVMHPAEDMVGRVYSRKKRRCNLCAVVLAKQE